MELTPLQLLIKAMVARGIVERPGRAFQAIEAGRVLVDGAIVKLGSEPDIDDASVIIVDRCAVVDAEA